LLGLALFVYFGRAAPEDDGGRRIVVSQAQVDILATQFQSTWNRPPTAEELNGLVDNFISEEILYREGKALGLDRDDAVIKRRVRQKLDVMFEESIAQSPPTDADLQAYLDAHPDTFRRPPVVSFRQVYLGADAGVEQRATAALGALARGADPASLGQPTLQPLEGNGLPLDLVARDFGRQFADQLALQPVGEWSGPIASGFGGHLVQVTSLQPAAMPALADVREIVVREWENARRQRAHAEALASLRSQYEIDVQAALPSKAAP
jgi:PPIC-type PPIASE domain